MKIADAFKPLNRLPQIHQESDVFVRNAVVRIDHVRSFFSFFAGMTIPCGATSREADFPVAVHRRRRSRVESKNDKESQKSVKQGINARPRSNRWRPSSDASQFHLDTSYVDFLFRRLIRLSPPLLIERTAPAPIDRLQGRPPCIVGLLASLRSDTSEFCGRLPFGEFCLEK